MRNLDDSRVLNQMWGLSEHGVLYMTTVTSLWRLPWFWEVKQLTFKLKLPADLEVSASLSKFTLGQVCVECPRDPSPGRQPCHFCLSSVFWMTFPSTSALVYTLIISDTDRAVSLLPIFSTLWLDRSSKQTFGTRPAWSFLWPPAGSALQQNSQTRGPGMETACRQVWFELHSILRNLHQYLIFLVTSPVEIYM